MRRLSNYIAKQPPYEINLIYSVNPLIYDSGEIIPAEERFTPTSAGQTPSYNIVSGNIQIDFHAVIEDATINCPVKTLWIPEHSAYAVLLFTWISKSSMKIELHNIYDNNSIIDFTTLNYIEFPFTITKYTQKRF